jgi:hypothetical protein
VAASNEFDSSTLRLNPVQRSRECRNDLARRKQVFESLDEIACAMGTVTNLHASQKIFTNTSSSRRQTDFSKRLPSLWG